MQFKMKTRSIKNQKKAGCCPPRSTYNVPYQATSVDFLSIQLVGETNYVGWKEQMLCLLDIHDMHGFIDGTCKKPRGKMTSKYKEWKRADAVVKGWIFGNISEDVMQTVIGLQTAHDVWNVLKTSYATSTPPPLPPPAASIDIKKSKDEYAPLCRAIQMGDWEKAKEFFNKDQDALLDKVNNFGQTTLHLAIGNAENVRFLENLLDLINPESLPTLVDNRGETALCFAAKLDNHKAAEKLVEKNPHLLFVTGATNTLPIQTAIYNSHKKTFLYLLQVCKKYIGLSQKEGHHSPFEGRMGVLLLNEIMWAGFFDVAYELLKEYPELALINPIVTKPLLWGIAKERDAFLSAKCYNFYQRFVYSHVPTKSHCLEDTHKIADIENQETNKANLVNMCTKIYPVIKRIYAKFWEVALLHVPHIKHLYEDKVKHNIAVMILKFICEEVIKLKSNHYEYYAHAFCAAVGNNTPEVIEVLIQYIPRSVWTTNTNGYTISQMSIMNRCEHVYSFLVHEVTHEKYLHNSIIDKDRNNLLHLAGQLAPTHKLNMVTGAALQMQRELQWFQNVSKLIRPKDMEAKNKKLETPIMVFRKEHEHLRQKGEEWMKKTADSYTITAALIITIVFAAAITVPGGNNEDTGKAIYEKRRSFIIFFLSNAISLFTSTTSLLLFLSILTARYAEEDFLYKLPKRLILGLVMLFMSVTTMLIAFGATLYITYGQENSNILIPIASITCLPIASFVTLQLPLLVDLISSTYAPRIFVKRSDLRIKS